VDLDPTGPISVQSGTPGTGAFAKLAPISASYTITTNGNSGTIDVLQFEIGTNSVIFSTPTQGCQLYIDLPSNKAYFATGGYAWTVPSGVGIPFSTQPAGFSNSYCAIDALSATVVNSTTFVLNITITPQTAPLDWYPYVWTRRSDTNADTGWYFSDQQSSSQWFWQIR
jgi:hypothetical protein